MTSLWYHGADDGLQLEGVDLTKYEYVQARFDHGDGSNSVEGVAKVGKVWAPRTHGRFVGLEVLAVDDGYYQWWLNQAAQRGERVHNKCKYTTGNPPTLRCIFCSLLKPDREEPMPDSLQATPTGAPTPKPR